MSFKDDLDLLQQHINRSFAIIAKIHECMGFIQHILPPEREQHYKSLIDGLRRDMIEDFNDHPLRVAAARKAQAAPASSKV